MTSNLGSEYLVNLREGEDTKTVEKEVMGVVRGHFRPEFLNRVDEIILFHRLRREDMSAIVDIQLRRLNRLLEDRKMTAQPRRQGKGLAGRQGLRSGLWRASAQARDPEMGAGPAGADAARRRDCRDGATVKLSVSHGRLTINGKEVGGEGRGRPRSRSRPRSCSSRRADRRAAGLGRSGEPPARQHDVPGHCERSEAIARGT